MVRTWWRVEHSRRKKRFGLLWVLIMAASLLATFSMQTLVAETTQPIRIAYPIQNWLTALDGKGNYISYTYEYLEMLAQTTGWDYEYVTVPGTLNEQIVTLTDMLEAGEVDLMGGMAYTEETAQRFIYCRNKCGTSHTVLQALKNSEYNSVGKGSGEIEPFRIAIVSTMGRIASEVSEYCQVSNIDFSFVTCKNLEHGIELHWPVYYPHL